MRLNIRGTIVAFFCLGAFAMPPVMASGKHGLPEVEPEKVGMSSERLKRIKPTLMKFVEEGKAAGFITAISRHGKLVHFETMGKMDVAAGKPMQEDAIFRWHSMTKPVIAVATMMLYEEGHFGLNDPIAWYLPEFSKMNVYQDDGSLTPAKEPIRIKHLLTHTAGLSYYLWNHPVGKMYQDAGLITNYARLNGTTAEDYVKTIASLPLIAEPGTKWEYSEGMGVLGRLVEVISGQPLSQFFRERIFKPLDMKDAGFFVPADKMDQLMVQYLPTKEGSIEPVTGDDLAHGIYGRISNDYSRPPSFESGSSGLAGSTRDYLRFAQMLANEGELDGVRLLSPASINLMMSNQLGPEFGDQPLGDMGSYAHSARGIGFGFCGLVVKDAAATTTIGSDGEYSWGGGASTDFWIDRKKGIVGLIMTQLSPPGAIPSRSRFHQLVYQAIIKD